MQPQNDTKAPLLQIVKGSKVYGGLHAIDGVDFELRAGEIHALLGENGAGKSTLIKIMTGVHQPDRGQISLAGQPVSIRSAAEAMIAPSFARGLEVSVARRVARKASSSA